MKIISCILLFLIVACGTRRAEVYKLKSEIKAQRELSLKLQNDITSNVNITKVANKVVIEPLNESDISTFDGTFFKNARITLEESKTESTAHLIDKSKKEVGLDEKLESDISEKEKESESKKPNPWLWSGITIVAVFIVWMLFKR